jgi:hypothetical protein
MSAGEALSVELGQLFVPRLLRREQLHEHRGMNRRRLRPLQAKQTGLALQLPRATHSSTTDVASRACGPGL